MRHMHGTPVAWVLASAFLTVVSGRDAAQRSAPAPGAPPVQADWPQWRGPNRDGAAASFTAPTRWPEQLTQRWKVDVGLGYATPIVVGPRVYMFARHNENESMTALDAASGTVLWRTSYPASFTMQSGAAQHGPGPKSTPVFSNGKVFAIGMTGMVTAFDAASGKILWQRPGTGVVPMFTTHAFSPLVDRGLVIFHVGGHDQGALTAFDVNTGDVKWRWDGDGPGYGSPIVADLDGARQIVTLTQRKLIGVEAATGTLLWERPYTTSSTTNAQTPNLFGHTLIFGDSGHPVQAFAVSKQDTKWATEVAWENSDVPMRLSNAVLVRDILFGLSTRNSGQYFAVDAKTGKTLWTSEPRQAAQTAIVRAGDLLFSLESDGELVIIRASAAAFEPVHRYKVAETDTWAPPVVSGTRVFVRDVGTLALWTWDAGDGSMGRRPVGASAAPPPAASNQNPNVSPGEVALRADMLFWESIKDKTDPALFDAYLRQFPNGTFRVLADARAKELRATVGASSASTIGTDTLDRAIRWASIPAGRFQMGCVPADSQCRDDEKARHWLDVVAFRMMTTDVTVGMYRAYSRRSGTSILTQPESDSRDDLPAANVSWDGAVAFCQASNWRLPTEAEWEYAARGGVDGAIYAWGNATTPVVNGQKMANVADEAGKRKNPGWTDFFAGYDDGYAEAAPVGTFLPNGFGLSDMAGNVSRWVSSLHKPYPYRADDGREDPHSRDRRVLRGGSYVTPPRGLRASYRVPHAPAPAESDYHGFRCVQSGR